MTSKQQIISKQNKVDTNKKNEYEIKYHNLTEKEWCITHYDISRSNMIGKNSMIKQIQKHCMRLNSLS